MTNIYLNSLQHTHFAQKPCFHSSSPFCAVISPKATILPKRPNFHLKSFLHTHFLYKPCFHLNSPNFTKVFFRTLIFPKALFSPKMPIFAQSPLSTLIFHSYSICTVIFPKSPILPQRSNFHLYYFWHNHFSY